MAVYVPRPLEPAWQSVIDRAARRPVDPRALGLMVERVSRRYAGEDAVIAPSDDLAARARFWLPRDMPKVALPVAELMLARALPERPLRVLDLGAGVGSTTLGLLRALTQVHEELTAIDEESDEESAPATHAAPVVERVVAVDRDEPALRVLGTALEEARARGLLPEGAVVETRVGDYADEATLAGGPYDLLLAGTTLVEHTRAAGDERARGEALAERLDASARTAKLARDGYAIVLEPASRPEARALQYARGALLERGWSVFAPCTHEGPCPLLARSRDWCHEDLPADLPDWLVSVARGAGLRYQGLTFSYLVVSRSTGENTALRSVRTLLRGAHDGSVLPARTLSPPRDSKGKTELFVCAPVADGGTKLMQLEREVKRAPKGSPSLSTLAKGDLVGLAGAAREHALAQEPAPVPEVEGASPRLFEHPTRVRPEELVAWEPAE